MKEPVKRVLNALRIIEAEDITDLVVGGDNVVKARKLQRKAKQRLPSEYDVRAKLVLQAMHGNRHKGQVIRIMVRIRPLTGKAFLLETRIKYGRFFTKDYNGDITESEKSVILAHFQQFKEDYILLIKEVRQREKKEFENLTQ